MRKYVKSHDKAEAGLFAYYYVKWSKYWVHSIQCNTTIVYWVDPIPCWRLMWMVRVVRKISKNCIRFNSWNSFKKKKTWEINQKKESTDFESQLPLNTNEFFAQLYQLVMSLQVKVNMTSNRCCHTDPECEFNTKRSLKKKELFSKPNTSNWEGIENCY